MKRGEICLVAGGAAYTGKPRLAVILQDDRFDATDSIVVCPFTTDPQNCRLRSTCRLMVDKIGAVPRRRLDVRIGVLTTAEMSSLNRTLIVFLGMGG